MAGSLLVFRRLMFLTVAKAWVSSIFGSEQLELLLVSKGNARSKVPRNRKNWRLMYLI